MSKETIKGLRVGRKPMFDETDVDKVAEAINEVLEECFADGVHPTDALLQAKLGIRSDKYITRYRNGVAPEQRVDEIQELFIQYKKIAEADLLQSGLDKTYSSRFAEFLLQNNHGYTTKQEVHNTGTTTIQFVDDLQEDVGKSAFERFMEE